MRSEIQPLFLCSVSSSNQIGSDCLHYWLYYMLPLPLVRSHPSWCSEHRCFLDCSLPTDCPCFGVCLPRLFAVWLSLSTAASATPLNSVSSGHVSVPCNPFSRSLVQLSNKANAISLAACADEENTKNCENKLSVLFSGRRSEEGSWLRNPREAQQKTVQ